ncbi:MAG TPA: hypothetical protein VFQ19_17355 [Nocardioidaceae bacterium]|nr:hypothetical protein [Nocardioidaceae bacterium]
MTLAKNAHLLPRALGGLTAAYGGYTLVRPQSLVRQLHTDRPETARKAGRAIGVRDLVSGLGMLAAPSGTALNAAIAARVAADTSDAVLLPRFTSERDRRNLIRAVALGWGAACAAAGLWAARKGAHR